MYGSKLARSVCACIGAMGITAATTTYAHDEDAPVEPAVNTGNISLSAGADVTTEYWFRGIGQENEGLIFQPYAGINLSLIPEGDITVDLHLDTWNSLHDRNDGDAWYESDFTAGVTLGLPHDLSLDVSYINLYNPAGSDIFAEEFDFTLAYDDSKLAEDLGLPFNLSPYATLAVEIDGGSDAGNDKGIYLELGIEPSFTIVESKTYPVTLYIPLTLGLSIDDYYENASGDSDTFGYFDAGLVLGMPLSFIPAEFGQWEATAGVHFLVLGDTATDISEAFGTGDDDFNIYGTIGFSMSY